MTICLVPLLVMTITFHLLQADSKSNGETVLANFFNSLLSTKKTPGAKGSRQTSRNEAAAEIEKMTKKS